MHPDSRGWLDCLRRRLPLLIPCRAANLPATIKLRHYPSFICDDVFDAPSAGFPVKDQLLRSVAWPCASSSGVIGRIEAPFTGGCPKSPWPTAIGRTSLLAREFPSEVPFGPVILNCFSRSPCWMSGSYDPSDGGGLVRSASLRNRVPRASAAPEQRLDVAFPMARRTSIHRGRPRQPGFLLPHYRCQPARRFNGSRAHSAGARTKFIARDRAQTAQPFEIAAPGRAGGSQPPSAAPETRARGKLSLLAKHTRLSRPTPVRLGGRGQRGQGRLMAALNVRFCAQPGPLRVRRQKPDSPRRC